jgi:transposase InsO family protein
MPWSQKSVETERQAFLSLVEQKQESFSQLCRQFGISRKTGYKWLGRARQQGNQGLKDRRRGRPANSDPDPLTRLIVKHKKRHPFWGSKKIQALLSRKMSDSELPSRSRVHRALKKAGLVKGKNRRRKGPVVVREPWQKEPQCNDIWGVDFKGCFCTGDGTKCFALTVTDYYSRFILCFELLLSPALQPVQQCLEKVFKRYGRPKAIRVDNGTPFGGGEILGLSKLSLGWRLAGIDVQFMEPGSPHQNGRHERMHLNYQKELCLPPARDFSTQRRLTQGWLKEFNFRRPHEALQMRCPGQLYCKSALGYQPPKPPFDYGHWPTHRVGHKGDLWWRNQRHFIGEAFEGYRLGCKPLGHGLYELYVADLLLGTFRDAEFFDFRPTVEIRKTPQPPRPAL